MAWFDIASLNYSGVHKNGYHADLVTVYNHLREVELKTLGAYKTTGWGVHGSPVSTGKPNMTVNHVTLGSNTTIPHCIDWLRNAIGLDPFTWEVVTHLTDIRKTPVGPRTIMELYCAIGRYVESESGYYTFPIDGYATEEGEMTLGQESTGMATSGFEQDACIAGYTSDTLDTVPFDMEYVIEDSPKYLPTLTGATTMTLEDLEQAYSNTKCFVHTISETIPEYTKADLNIWRVRSSPIALGRVS